ncbi:glycosyltransferase family 1 protein [Candidatus Woesearchaeota archaeon]|nr:glycosyltransferase family 1 protein [Candidatus Woesearchaeota archaeon]
MERILLVTNTLGKWGEINGVVYTYKNLIRYFKETKTKVDVITYGPENSYETHGTVTITVHKPTIPLQIDEKLWIDLGMELTDLKERFRKNKYTVVHSAVADPLGMMAADIAKENNCPLVTVYHTAVDYYTKVRMGKRMGRQIGSLLGKTMSQYMKWYYNKSDLILAPSKYIKNQLSEKFKPRIEVLGRGIDTGKFNPRQRTKESKKVQALYVGRVALEKNMQMLVEIFSRYKEAKLKVVGDGNYLKEMRKKLPEAAYTGEITGKRLYEQYANADFFVFPSEADTFGNVVLQGLASGLPVIVTDKMAPKELIQHGKTGFIAKTKKEFEEYVQVLTENKKLRKEMGMEAVKYAGRFTWEKIFENLLQYYKLAKRIHKKSDEKEAT